MDFGSFLDDEFEELCQVIFNQGFKVCVVGGTVRDFFLNKPNKHDYDCELRPLTDQADLLGSFNRLVESLRGTYQTEELAYNVYRIFLNQSECEITLPRIEEFNNNFSHSNFKAHYIADQDFSQGPIRRDFTVNSMLMCYENEQWTFQDPLDGKKALKEKRLIKCSNDFFQDPVRFLRAIRFAIDLDFLIDDDILKALCKLDIEDIPSHYVRLEASKCTRSMSYLIKLLGCLRNKSVSQYEKQIYQLEANHSYSNRGIKDLFRNYFFIEVNTLKDLMSLTDISLNLFEFKNIFDFSLYVDLDVESFKSKNGDYIIKLYKKLLDLDPEIYKVFATKNHFELTYRELHLINSYKVDLDGFRPEDKKYASFLEKVKKFYVN